MPGVYQMREKNNITMSRLMKFSKHCLGYGARINESPYSIATLALSRLGYPKSAEKRSDKNHVLKHRHVIDEYLKLHKKEISTTSATRKKDFAAFNAFYKSDSWRRLRYEALLKNDGKCCVCGASKKTGAVLHVDHIKPRYKYPDLELCLDNLQVLCEACNMGKGGWDETDWREPKNEKETT